MTSRLKERVEERLRSILCYTAATIDPKDACHPKRIGRGGSIWIEVHAGRCGSIISQIGALLKEVESHDGEE